MCDEAYFEAQRIRVKKLYAAKHIGFGDAASLAHWYVEQLQRQHCKCFYCDTSIHDINKLIAANLLKTRSVKGTGKRGPVLEIDKQGNGYNKKECVLACYYCNNDKSYTCSKEDYKKYFGPNRKQYFILLMEQLQCLPN
jgi:hypothetical protein